MASTINEDEAALYDRQIRLWGLDAQNRLRNGSVLLVGLDGLGAEVAKNLMLVGLKSLTLIDDTKVTPIEEAQFFIDQSKQNSDMTRAQACIARCQTLNPLVQLLVECGPVQSNDKTFFKQFSLVCLIGQSSDVICTVNSHCIDVGVMLVSGCVHGWFGAAFFDFLDQHEYLDEKQSEDISEEVVSLDEDDAEPEIKRKKVEQHGDVPVTAKKSIERFTRYEALLNIDWQTKSTARLGSKLPAAFFATNVMGTYKCKHKALPNRPLKGEDIELRSELEQMWAELLTKCGVKDTKKIKCSFDTFYQHCFGQLSPVCAVTGGLIAQEIIKALSHKDTPMNNTFYFSGLESSGVVLRLPPLPR